MLLFKTASAEWSTLCAFVRSTNLSQFFKDIWKKTLEHQTQDDSMQNMNHPFYKGKLWVVIKGDKGGFLMKYAGQFSVFEPSIFGMFEAADTVKNRTIFQQSFREQLRIMQIFGLEVESSDGQKEVKPIELFLGGDKAFLYDQNGMQGASSLFPSSYSLVTLKHLKTAHLDGSPHTPTTCPVKWRDL